MFCNSDEGRGMSGSRSRDTDRVARRGAGIWGGGSGSKSHIEGAVRMVILAEVVTRICIFPGLGL